MTESSSSPATKATPWGVSLKKTPKGRNPVPSTRRKPQRLNKDEKAEQSIKEKRAKLRPTQTRPRRTRSKIKSASNDPKYTRPASRGWKLRDTSTPLFGVVLRRLGTINEDEEFCDLDLMALEARTSNNKPKPNLRSFGKSNEMDNSTTRFGVRLKPNRNASASCTRQRPSRTKSSSVAPLPLKTYQIDLNPTQKSDSGKDKSFLEVKLRPVNKPSPSNGQTTSPPTDQTTVEFQLRHVVAPANGGPHRTASQALFQVPLLKPLKPGGQNNNSNRQPTTEQGMADLLQIGISNLSPPVAREDGVTLQSIQIQAKQVDPETQEERVMKHVVDVELKHKEGDLEAKENSTIPEWTMKVELKKTQEGAEDTEEGPVITVKPVTKPTKNDDSSDSDDDDGFAKEADGAMLDCHYGGSSSDDSDDDGDSFGDDEDEFGEAEEDEEADKKKKKKKRFRKKKKQVGQDGEYEYFEECSGSEYEEVSEDDGSESEYEEIEDEFEEEEIIEEEEIVEEEIVEDTSTADTAESTENTEADKKIEEEPAPPLAPEEEPKKEEEAPPAPEKEEEPKKEEAPAVVLPRKPKKKDPPPELTQEKKKDLVLWYNRLNCPNRKKMIEKVKKLPADCHITPEDVEALPWMPGGFMLDQRVLNKMILEDWQGVEEKK